MKLAQDYLKDSASGETRGGFNSRLLGDPLWKTMEMIPAGTRWGERSNGWRLADEMIRAGKIFSVFDNKGKDIVLKCFPDGNKWCCVGESFINLQESDCYVFGDTWQGTIDKFITTHSEGDK